MGTVGEVLCLLFAGHAVGDFCLQTDSLAFEKERSRAAMLRHCAIYAMAMAAATALVVFGMRCDLRAALGAWAGLSLAHALIDGIARPLLKRFCPGDLRSFLLDQLLHLACCALAALYLAPRNMAELSPYWSETLVWVASLLLSGAPVCVLVKLILGELRDAAHDPSDATVQPGEPVNSGRVIGILERLLVCTLALLGEFGAIAFVITAKSIARYEKMKDDKVFAEIYLVGTLASVAGAIAVPLVVRWMAGLPA